MKSRTVKLLTLIAFTFFEFGYLLFASGWASAEIQTDQLSQAKLSQAKRRPAAKTSPRTPRAQYSKFSHNLPQHKAQECGACHKFPTANWKEVRKGDAAFPDVTEYPQHEACVGCHRQQFFSGAQPVICSICHMNVTPSGGPRHAFPNPAELFDASKKGQMAVSEFGINFPHDKHADVVGQREADPDTKRDSRFVNVLFRQKSEPKAEESEPKSCAVCHQTYQPQGDSDDEFVTKPPKGLAEDAFWLKKGTFKTSPTSHAACFTCHSEDSGLKPAPADCNLCHKLLPAGQQMRLTEAHGDFDPKLAAKMGVSDKTTLEKWSRRDTAKFRHEWLPHAGLSCASCHNFAVMNTMDEKTRKVSVKSCGGEGTGCHIETSTEGILNLELEKKKSGSSFQCSKCHINNGSRPAPETHVRALPAEKKK